jgi:hypothetical protein
MNQNKKLMCWSHFDLDGVLSCLVLKWAFPKANIEYELVTIQNFREKYTKWLSKNNPEDYDKIFFMDLGIYEHKDLIDMKNVFIIDHHEGHDSSTYKNAKSIIKEYSSNCLLAYKAFKKLYNITATKEQLHLLLLGDDFDSYQLKFKESLQLNTVFWGYTDKLNEFMKHFHSGFRGFNLQQQNMLLIHDVKLQKIKDESSVFSGTVKIQGKDRKVCSIFAGVYINEVADYLINDHGAEVALIVNTNNNHVSYRRQKDSDVNLFEFAYKLAGGAGHEYSSGSEISEKFILFTKQLEQIK